MYLLDQWVILPLKYSLGWFLSIFFPGKNEQIRNNFTIPDYVWHGQYQGHYIDKLIRFYLGERARRREKTSPELLGNYHKEYWKNQSEYYEITKNRISKVYIPAYGNLIEKFSQQFIERDIKTVCEFGAGDGQWLDYLSQQWPMIDRFVGVDLSEKQIAANHDKYPHVEFQCADLTEWIVENITSHTLYHTNGGVLEYLSKDAVLSFLHVINLKAYNSLILLMEPLYGNYDIDVQNESVVNSYEFSYSHNYVHLLESAGFAGVRHREYRTQDQRWIIVEAFSHPAY